MVVATTSWWKPVGFLLLGNLLYFAAIIFLLQPVRYVGFGAMIISNWLPFVYFILPAILCLIGLSFARLLSLRSTPMRTLFLVAWSLVLPGLTITSIIFGGMYACHLGWLPNCLPY